MDEYRQPRPVLYGTWEDEAPAQTLTLPVRSGPPRYPPAPPLAGDAPDPFEPSRSGGFGTSARLGTMSRPGTRFAPYLAVLFALSLGLALLQIYLGIDQGLLLVEVLVGMIIVPSLWWLSSRTYFVALRLVALPIILGVVFAQWLSPLMWVSIATAIYLLRPSLHEYYKHMAEINSIQKSGRVLRREANGTFFARLRIRKTSNISNEPWRKYLSN